MCFLRTALYPKELLLALASKRSGLMLATAVLKSVLTARDRALTNYLKTRTAKEDPHLLDMCYQEIIDEIKQNFPADKHEILIKYLNIRTQEVIQAIEQHEKTNGRLKVNFQAPLVDESKGEKPPPPTSSTVKLFDKTSPPPPPVRFHLAHSLSHKKDTTPFQHT